MTIRAPVEQQLNLCRKQQRSHQHDCSGRAPVVSPVSLLPVDRFQFLIQKFAEWQRKCGAVHHFPFLYFTSFPQSIFPCLYPTHTPWYAMDGNGSGNSIHLQSPCCNIRTCNNVCLVFYIAFLFTLYRVGNSRVFFLLFFLLLHRVCPIAAVKRVLRTKVSTNPDPSSSKPLAAGNPMLCGTAPASTSLQHSPVVNWLPN